MRTAYFTCPSLVGCRPYDERAPPESTAPERSSSWRTSIEPGRTTRSVVARSTASSIVAASITKYPPTTSFVSANGPSTTSGRAPGRRRAVRADDAGMSGAVSTRAPAAASRETKSSKPAAISANSGDPGGMRSSSSPHSRSRKRGKRASFGGCRLSTKHPMPNRRLHRDPIFSAQALEEGQRPVLVEHVVEVPALRALDARGAAVAARAAADHRGRVAHPAFELLEAALGDPDTAGVAVVDEDGGPRRLRVDVRREAADVPAVAHRPQRQHGDHRVLGRVQRAEQLRHLVELGEVVRLGQVPDRLGRERGRRQLEVDDLDALLPGDRLALVPDDLLGDLDLAEEALHPEPPLAAARLDDPGHRLLLGLRVPVAGGRLDEGAR